MPDVWECDSIEDCADGSDESRCAETKSGRNDWLGVIFSEEIQVGCVRATMPAPQATDGMEVYACEDRVVRRPGFGFPSPRNCTRTSEAGELA